MNKIIPIRALKDNYIWALHHYDNNEIAVVDPGEAAPVIRYINDNHLRLSTILVTHHHADHTAGITALCQSHPHVTVWGPSRETIPHLTHGVSDNTIVPLFDNTLLLRVMDIPGHTIGHVAYYHAGLIFCGDTLFSCGCGRLFEGTPAQMFASLQKIQALTDDTLIYCAHEYTLANLRFASTVDPTNPAILQRSHDAHTNLHQGKPTLPVSLANERQTNPFLRCHLPAIRSAVEQQFHLSLPHEEAVFTYLRQWKDHFQ